jgi:DNA-binding SARP family transcriptional activator/class 3 adenylate cyclase/tetratricopeptide (TPR) repeat protein
MSRLALHMLGTWTVHVDDVALELGHDKPQALLAYLAVESRSAYRRDRLAGLLWPDIPEASARRNLRVNLHRLRDAIGDRDTSTPHLLVTRETLQLGPDVYTDLATFDRWRAASAAHTHERIETCPECAEWLGKAVALYQGDLLPGFSLDSAEFETWLVTQREALHLRVLDVLQHLAAYHLAQEEYPAALTYARQQLTLEPWHERAHRQAMEALARGGQRAAAVAQYETCARILGAELGIESEPESVALYEQIRRGDLAPPTGLEPPLPPRSGPRQAPITPPAAAAIIAEDAPHLHDAPLPLDESGPVAGRRITSFVLAEVSGAADLLRSTGLEAWAERLHELLGLLRGEVLRYGGSVVQLHDTGLVGAFGAEQSHEDDAERAVLAALGMAATLAASPQAEDEKLALRIGVTTGEAVVLSEDTGTLTVHATALARAHDLQAQVVPGTVWVAGDTYRHVEDRFEWAWLGEVLDADHAPTYMYRPLAPVAEIATEHDVGGLRASLVGRDAELQALTDAIARLRAGIGGIVTVVGEAGIGKSRLIAEARGLTKNAAPDAGAGNPALRWVAGHWLSYTEGMAYHGWQELLRRLLALPDTCTRAACSAMEERVADLCPEQAERIQPYLARLLALPVEAAAAEQLDRLVVAGLLQGAVQRAVADFLGCVAAQTPLVLVLEDIHWADAASLDLLESLLPLTDQAPLLLIAVLRPVRVHRCWRLRETAVREYVHRHTDILLPALSPEESESLTRRLLALRDRHAVPDDDVVRGIWQRAEGNPFFTAEIVRSLEGNESDQTLPVTVQEVLMARIDRLPAAARQVLQLAAVVGRSFRYSVLADIVANAGQDAALAPGTPEPANAILDRALLRLVRAQMIRREINVPAGEHDVREDPSYVFEHQLTLEAAYGSLLLRKRRALHRRVAEALERLYPEHIVSQLALLAEHWVQAGDIERAIAFLQRAGEQAAAQYANAEALALFSRALALLPEGDDETRYALLISRERIHSLTGERQAQSRDLDDLEELANRWGDKFKQAEVAIRRAEQATATYHPQGALEAAQVAIDLAHDIGDAGLEALAHLRYAQAWVEPSAASVYPLERLRQALSLAQSASLRRLEAEILQEIGANLGAEQGAEGREMVHRALAYFREVGDRAGEGAALGALARTYARVGEYSEAREVGLQALAVLHDVGSLATEGFRQYSSGYSLMCLARYSEALALLTSARSLCRDVGDSVHEARTLVCLNAIFDQVGDYRQAASALEEALAFPTERAGLVTRAWALAQAMLLAVHQADATRAAAYMQLAMDFLARAGDHAAHGWLSHQRANIHTMAGHTHALLGHETEAVAAYHESLQVDRKMGPPGTPFEARAGLARVYHARGEFDRALAEVEQIVSYIQSGGHFHGTAEPLRPYLTCYRVLSANDDPRAVEVLARAHVLLMEGAAAIDDEVLRDSYLGNVETNRQLIAAHAESASGERSSG